MKFKLLFGICLICCSCSSDSKESRFDDSGYWIVNGDTVMTKTDSSLVIHKPIDMRGITIFSYDGFDFFGNVHEDYIADGDGWHYGPPRMTKQDTVSELTIKGMKGLYRKPKEKK